MFDNIGRDLDEQANRRRAESVVYTTALVGVSLGVFLWFTAQAVVEAGEQILETAMIEIEIDDGIDDASPPPPPPPPPGADEEEEEEEETETDPDEVVEEVQELQEIVEKPIVKSAQPKGSADGVEGGVEGGVVGGVQGGVVGGVVGGTGLGGFVDYKDVKPKNIVEPVYPNPAKAMNLGDQRCRVTVSINAKGIPEDVKVAKCPEVFHEEVKRAMFKSRWWPYRSGGSKQPARFTFLITFRLS